MTFAGSKTLQMRPASPPLQAASALDAQEVSGDLSAELPSTAASDDESSTVVGDAEDPVESSWNEPPISAGPDGENPPSYVIESSQEAMLPSYGNGKPSRKAIDSDPMERRQIAGKKKIRDREGHAPHHRSAIQMSLKNQPLQPNQESIYILLEPINDTFSRKCIQVPFFPNTLLLGRQINSRTQPTPENGYFDSRVLSRQHAEIWADSKTGQVWIRDIKSSNGTFINGQRLSPENQESEPHELKANDTLELGINITNEDSKSVQHNKVAARVEKVGPLSSLQFVVNGGHGIGGGISLSYADINPSANLANGHAPGLNAYSGNGTTLTASMTQGGPGRARHRIISRMFASSRANTKGPISLDMIIKKVNAQVQLAKDQASELRRVSDLFESLAESQAADAVLTASTSRHAEDRAGSTELYDKDGVSNQSEDITSQSSEISWRSLPQADAAPADQKLIALAISLQTAEQELKEYKTHKHDLEKLLERESRAREDAEAQLLLAQRELQRERQQAIKDLRDEENDAVTLEEGSTAADMIVLMEHRERQRRKSLSTGIDEDDVWAQLDQVRREAMQWESRARKAEQAAERNFHALNGLIKELQVEGFLTSREASPAKTNGFASPESSAERGRPLAPKTSNPSIPRIATLTPEGFRQAQTDVQRTPTRVRSRMAENFKTIRRSGVPGQHSQREDPGESAPPISPRSVSSASSSSAEKPASWHTSVSVAPFVSAAAVVTLGLTVMRYLNDQPLRV